jgi:hypothetical protein
MALEAIQTPTEMSNRDLVAGKGLPICKADITLSFNLMVLHVLLQG